MKIHRFIDQNFDLNNKHQIITDREIINQWKNVLHLKIGENLILGDGNGYEATGEITKLAGDLAEIKLAEKILNQNEPTKQVALYCAILKKENFELVVQKAVEVGVTKIIPIITERTIKQNLNFDRLAKIAKEAAEQSSRGTIPAIASTTNLATALVEAVDSGPTVVFDLTATELFNNTSLPVMNIFIGPEGGFTEKEVALAEKAGATVASLGPLTLRAETAAIITSYLAVNGL